MSEQANASEEAVQFRIKEQPKQAKQVKLSLEQILDYLKSVQDDIGQIVELSSEEETLVGEFFDSLLKLIESFSTTVPVSITALPSEMSGAVRASIDPSGKLLVLDPDGEMILKDLTLEENRDLLINVLEDVLPKLRQIFSTRRQKIEGRMKFLSSVTKEIQKMSRAFSKALT